MNNKNYLVYFLNSMKDELEFEDSKDFKNKVESNLDFKIKIQKFVFLAKYFGWNNSYSYNLYRHGPYSPVLTEDYYSNDLFDYTPLEISDLDFDSLKSFIRDKSIDYLESATTILLYKKFCGNISLDTAIEKLGEIKSYISPEIVEKSYYDVKDLKLTDKFVSRKVRRVVLKDVKNNLNKKIIENITLFENFEINYNRVFILGSLDYLRIVLREEKLNNYMKNDLFNLISQYVQDVEKIYSSCNGDNNVFENMNLSSLEEFFDRLQDYISNDLDVVKRLDDDDFDESLFYYSNFNYFCNVFYILLLTNILLCQKQVKLTYLI